ncbi:MAG: DUF4868 domain-containing protein [Spirochaetes bacterium]|nr:DUF4868 domain-containing protein [Spirochaetota bacterium]
MKLNLLALMTDNSLRRIVSNGDLQNELTKYFLEIKSQFEKNKEEVDFDGRYSVDEDQILVIKNYNISENILNAVENPLTLNILKLKDEVDYIKSLLCGIVDKTNTNNTFVIFQSFDRRKVLSKSFTLLNTNDTYTKLSDPGLIINERIDLLYRQNKILFLSFHNARKIFDLSDYYKEATNEDLKEFVKIGIINVEDENWFIDNADSVIRKKVALLQKNQVLSNTTLVNIQKQAAKFGLEITVKDNKIHLPKDKATIKNIIKFLDEDYFIAPLTGRQCITNSKRYLQDNTSTSPVHR